MKPKPITFERATAENMPEVGTRVAFQLMGDKGCVSFGSIERNDYVLSDGELFRWGRVEYFGILEWETDNEENT
jgi:hypothetical protein